MKAWLLLMIAAACGARAPDAPTAPKSASVEDVQAHQDAHDIAVVTAAREEVCQCGTPACIGAASKHHHDAIELMKATGDRRAPRDRALDAVEIDVSICIATVMKGAVQLHPRVSTADHDRRIARVRAWLARPDTGVPTCDHLARTLGALLACDKLPENAAAVQLDFMADMIRDRPLDGPWDLSDGQRTEWSGHCANVAAKLDALAPKLGCPAPD